MPQHVFFIAMKFTTEGRLRELLIRRAHELGKTLKTMATEAGLARSCLYKLADGTTRDPSVQTLLRLARAMEISPVALFRLYGNMNAPAGGTAQRALSPSRAFGLNDARDMAMLNADVTIPHHAVVNGGEVFEKIWEIQNVGSVSWTRRRLARIDNPCADFDSRSAANLVERSRLQLVSLERVIAIPRTLPGSTVRLSTYFVAPKENCSVASIWRIEDRFMRPCYDSAFFLEVMVTVIDQ